MAHALRITPVDLADKAALRRWYDGIAAAHVVDRPDAPLLGFADVLANFDDDDPEERIRAYTVERADGTPAASGVLFAPLLDNLDKAYAELAVVPEQRGHGVGDAAVEEVERLAREEGRSLLLVEGWFPRDADDTHPVRAFARRHGYRVGNTEQSRTLDLPLPEARLDAWAAEAAAHHDGYELQTHLDRVPEELLPSLVELFNLLPVDAPTGEVDFEAGGLTVETHRQAVERRLSAGRRIIETVAVREGRVVAHSTLSVPPPGESMPFLSQWGTFVHRGHRGHRLGLATKVANLRVVQRDFPERTVVKTTNSPDNAPMNAINADLGFVPGDVLAEFVKRV